MAMPLVSRISVVLRRKREGEKPPSALRGALFGVLSCEVVCVRMTVSTRVSITTLRDSGKYIRLSSLGITVYFAAAIHAIMPNKDNSWRFVSCEKDLGEDGLKVDINA